MNKKIVIISTSVIIAILLFFGFKNNNGLTLKVLVNSAQILTPTKAIVLKNNQTISDARVFKMDETVKGAKVDAYVLWLPTNTEPYYRDIIMISKDSNNVGQPNSSKIHYQLYYSYFLFQLDGADWFIPFSDSIKGPGYDPKLNITEKEISFVLQNATVIKINLEE